MFEEEWRRESYVLGFLPGISRLQRAMARSEERSKEEQVVVWLSGVNNARGEQMYNISSLHKHGV